MSDRQDYIRTYNMAQAFLQFKDAYKNLVDCGTVMPDLDVSEKYPFFILDFEAIAPNVYEWCIAQYNKLMISIPDYVHQQYQEGGKSIGQNPGV